MVSKMAAIAMMLVSTAVALKVAGPPGTWTRNDLSTADSWTPVEIGGIVAVKSEGYAWGGENCHANGNYDYRRIGYKDNQPITASECVRLGYYLLQQDGPEKVRAVVHSPAYSRCDIQSGIQS